METGRRRTRLFVAARPPEEVRAALERLPRPVEPGVRWVPPDQWHVTLRFLGDADADEVLEALTEPTVHDAPGSECPRSLRGWASGAGAISAVLGPVVSRLGRDVVVLPVRGLDDLARSVVDATAHLGTPPDPRGFAGHLTLARLRHRAACGVAGARFTARWDVEELELVSSELAPDGARHTVLATVALDSGC